MAGSTQQISGLFPERRFSALQIRVLLLCAAIMLLDGFDIYSIAFLSPFYSKEWQLSVAEISIIFTATALGMSAGYFGVGPIADRIGRRPVITAATILFGLLTLVLVASRGFYDFTLWRTLASLAFGAAIPNAVALVVEYAPPRYRSALVASMFAIYAAGVALAGALAAMLATKYGWRTVFIFGGLMPLVIGLLLALGLPESIEFIVEKGRDLRRATALLRRIVPDLPADWHAHVAVAPKTGQPLRMLFEAGRAPITLLIWFLFAMNLAEIGLFSSWLPTLLHSAGQPIPQAIRSTIAFQMGGLVAGLLMGLLLIGRTGARLVAVLLVAEIAGTILIVVLGLVLQSVAATVVAAFLVGLFVGGSTSGLNGFTATFYPTVMRATGHGAASAAGRLAGAIGPMLGGALMASGWAMPVVFLGIAVPPLLGSFAIVILLRLQKGSGGADRQPGAPLPEAELAV